MEGIILFADDAIFQDSFERKLFENLIQTSEYPVLPINNLEDFEKTTKSISTFRAILLDWEFIERIEEIESKKNPLDILLINHFYSLIFIYSQIDIGNETKETLKKKFGNKIDFLPKIKDDAQVKSETEKIFAAIKSFQDANTHLSVPFVWSHAINKSVQSIFDELEKADKFWIRELYYSSVRKVDKATGEPKEVEVEPTIEVINLFQNLLSEKLIQNTVLQTAIGDYAKGNFKQQPDEKAIKELYSRLYYTNTLDTDTVMTGDVFELNEGVFGIVISPECDMNKLIKKNEKIEVLCFVKEDFAKVKDYCDNEDEIKRAYNQEIAAIHLLPVFPFSVADSTTALIDFRFSLKFAEGKFLDENKGKRKRKINSPYIQQLRQRYLAYIGRVGVPAIPNSLRTTK